MGAKVVDTDLIVQKIIELLDGYEVKLPSLMIIKNIYFKIKHISKYVVLNLQQTWPNKEGHVEEFGSQT